MSEIFNQQKQNEPVTKRSKLMLPEPQISDFELEQVVKLGMNAVLATSQAAAQTPSNNMLLNDYNQVKQSDLAQLRTPRLPEQQDTVLNESKNLLALQFSETPLKGGENTPLHNEHLQSGSMKTPKPGALALTQHSMQTPNPLFTPFRTPSQSTGAPQTPQQRANPAAATPGVRDKFNINQNDEFGSTDDQFTENPFSLKKGLAKLPAPKNNYEIVMPEEEEEGGKEAEESEAMETSQTMDQAELDELEAEKIRLKQELEFKMKSKAIQRNLPRPKSFINTNIVRPVADAQNELNEWQAAEELIKKEMLYMLNMDAVNEPTVASRSTQFYQIRDKSMAYLRENCSSRDYNQKFTLDELKAAGEMLDAEIPFIKKAMGHGDLTDDVYAQVWEECYNQVLFVPSSSRFTRASVTSRKDKIESLQERFKANREIMGKEAKQAAKLEQKLKILLGGYQVSQV